MLNNSIYFKYFNPERYEYSMFKNADILNQIKEKGYCVLKLLSKEEVEKLVISYNELSDKISEGFGELFWPSGRHPDPEIRNFAKQKIEEVVPKKLQNLLIEDSFRFIGGTYLVKPPSENSALNPHQDSAHVNEFTHFSVYAWIPLQDVDQSCGGMRVLPGSHKLSIKQRSLNVPWVLEPHLAVLNNYMLDLDMKAGEVLLFDSALIHSSPPNLTDKTRVAVNFYIHPLNHPFTHYYRDDSTAEGMVEAYEVTPDFYYFEDFEKKPSDKYKRLPDQLMPIQSLQTHDVEEICKLLLGNKPKKGLKNMLTKLFK